MKNIYNTFRQHPDTGVEINISPLIDVVFLLLIFFIVTTVFVEETGIQVDKPRAASARDLEKNSIMIALTRDGRIVYGNRDVSLNDLRGIVAQQLKTREMPVILIADRETSTGRLLEAMDECKLAGAKQISVAASRTAKGN